MKKNIDDYWELAEYDFKCLEFDYYNKEKKTMPNSLNEKNLDTLLAIVKYEDRIKPLEGICEFYCQKNKKIITYDIDKFPTYYDFWKFWKYPTNGIDPDDSKGNNPYMRAIYYLLWGKKIEDGDKIDENGWGNFAISHIADQSKFYRVPWGGDGMNTIATYTDKIEAYKHACDSESEELKNFNNSINNFAESTHQLGNFVLVPAYFNQWKGVKGDIQECFDRGLLELKQNKSYCMISLAKQNLKNSPKGTLEEKVEVIIKHFSEFNSDNFNMYINTFFLWDYVAVQNGDENKANYIVKSMKKDYTESDVLEEELSEDTYQVDKGNVAYYVRNADWAIRRRSIFMAAMLYIANEFKENNEIDQNITEIKNDTWKHWQVSYSYKIIMNKVFLTNHFYKDYCEVMNKIVAEIDKVKLEKSTVNDIKKALNNAMIRINALDYNNINITAQEN